MLDPLVEVCAPPELRTTTGGLVLPGAETDTDVSDPEDADVPAAVIADGSVAVDVCAPPELRTTPFAADCVSTPGEDSADSAPDLDSDSLSVDADVDDEDGDVEVEESASGSADAMPGMPTTAAPTPRAAASSPTRPMYPA